MTAVLIKRGVRCLAVVALAGSAVAAVGPAAYWRHEEGPLGGTVPPVDNIVLDSSGYGNHMRTFNDFTGAKYTDVVAPLPLRSGLANTLALDFSFDQDGGGPDLNDDNYAPDKPISSLIPDALTVEFAFKMDVIGGYQTLLGKDGRPLSGPIAPLAIKVRGDDFPGGIPNQLQVEWIDGDGDTPFVTNGATIAANTWYHLAFVLTATQADLYLATTGAYQLVGSETGDFAGAGGNVLYQTNGTYTVGRGMFNGGVTDWSDAIIDEVRITAAALLPDEFLFVPEPASVLTVLLGGALLRRR